MYGRVIMINQHSIFGNFNPRRHKVKKVHEGIRRGGGGQADPSPSTFDTIHPIDTLAHIMSILFTFNSSKPLAA